jgi:hypothetical protein
MWCAAAAAVISLWIWPRALDARASERAVTKGNKLPLAASWPTARRTASESVIPQKGFDVGTERGIKVSNEWTDPVSTGSASTAPLVSVVTTPDNVDLAPARTSGHGASPVTAVAGPNEVASGDHNVDCDVATDSLLPLCFAHEGWPVVHIDLPNEFILAAALVDPRSKEAQVPPTSLPDAFNLPEIETVSAIPEQLVPEFASGEHPVSASTEAASVEKAASHQIVGPTIEVLSGGGADGERSAEREQDSAPARVLNSGDRDLLISRGEGLLARGDLSGARLSFSRAAAGGDPRGATGMARTFDPETFRKVRVIGMRPDPQQAAEWHARSKVLQAVASAR